MSFLAECPANSCRRGQVNVNMSYTLSSFLSKNPERQERAGKAREGLPSQRSVCNSSFHLQQVETISNYLQ